MGGPPRQSPTGSRRRRAAHHVPPAKPVTWVPVVIKPLKDISKFSFTVK
jgi:hypothetical protein